MHCVGSFHRLDGDRGQPFDDHGLAHVDASQFLGQLPAELNILHLGTGRFAPGQWSVFHEQLRSEIGGGGEDDPVFRVGVDERGQQRVVLAVLRTCDEMGIERAAASPVGQMTHPTPAMEQHSWL